MHSEPAEAHSAIRAAAEASVNEPFRQALERIADGHYDEADIERASR